MGTVSRMPTIRTTTTTDHSDAEESAYGSDPLDANSVANAPPDNLFLSNLSILENLSAGAGRAS